MQQHVARIDLCSEEMQFHLYFCRYRSPSARTQQGRALGWGRWEEQSVEKKSLPNSKQKVSGSYLSTLQGLYPLCFAFKNTTVGFNVVGEK